MSIIKINEVDLTKITFGEVKTSKIRATSKSVSMYYNGKPFQVALPKARLPFGLSRFEDAGNFNIVFSADPTDPRSLAMIDTFKQIQDRIIDEALRGGWYGPKATRESVLAKFKPLIRFSESYPPQITAKVQSNNDRFQMQVYDAVKDNTDAFPLLDVNAGNYADIITPGSHAQAILELSYVWLNSSIGFGITARAVQIKLFKNERIPRQCVLQDDPEDNVALAM